MPHLSDLFDAADFVDAIEAGYVREQRHPDLPLRILNYSEKTQYEGAWNDVTRQCRGLIVDPKGFVVARPWKKFFNYGDPACGTLDLNARAEVVDKMDGSLGVMYWAGDEWAGQWAIATRGSFASEQAIHGTRVLRERYSDFVPPEGMTVLFEIVYPGNRIVCDYGDTDDLILLGAVDIETGEAVGPDWVSGWPGPQAATFPARTLGEALALPPRPNAEGVVVRLVDSGAMTKIKQADYVALHRIVTGLNARVVWEQIGDGRTIADICKPLPDEFHGWVTDVADRLVGEARRIEDLARGQHEMILGRLPGVWTRKDYAVLALHSPHKPWLFMLLDGKDMGPKIWRTLRPSGEERPVNVSEDTA